MRYRTVHRTSYLYAEPVSAAYGEHHLLPRSTPTQQVLAASVAIDPAPDERRERRDVHGNRVEHYGLYRDHDRLDVTASSVVEVSEPPAMVADLPWEDVRDLLRTHDNPATYDARQMLLDSPQVAAGPRLEALAREAFRPRRPVTEAYTALVSLIAERFEFDPTATTVTTAVDEVLDRRAGVCQDFAHLAIGCLRSLGLPARYVSGYIETDPPPGQRRLQGADASHAWVSLYVPDHGWFDTDPTNDQFVGTRHVTVGWGRDYGDVSPLKGVIYTEGPTRRLEVAVDVIAIDDDVDPTALADATTGPGAPTAPAPTTGA